MRKGDPKILMEESTRSIVRHVEAMLAFQKKGAVVFDNGNLIRTHAKNGGVANSFDIPIFTEAFLRPLFARAIGPFRWIALSNDPEDIRKIDDLLLRKFGHNRIVSNWVQLARKHVPFEGLPARIAWLGHGERTELGLEVNRMVRDGELSAPIAFTRDHLDAGAMAHPNIMTENMRDGSDAIADWPLLECDGELRLAGRSCGDPFRRRRLFRVHDQCRRDVDCRWQRCRRRTPVSDADQ